MLDKHRTRYEPEKELILDDVEFEIELIKQVEVNIDSILLLVARWRDARGDGSDKDMEALVTIVNAVDASSSPRNKRDLILEFVDSISVSDVRTDLAAFIAERREAEPAGLIAEEKLKEAETRDLVARRLPDRGRPPPPALPSPASSRPRLGFPPAASTARRSSGSSTS